MPLPPLPAPGQQRPQRRPAADGRRGSDHPAVDGDGAELPLPVPRQMAQRPPHAAALATPPRPGAAGSRGRPTAADRPSILRSPRTPALTELPSFASDELTSHPHMQYMYDLCRQLVDQLSELTTVYEEERDRREQAEAEAAELRQEAAQLADTGARNAELISDLTARVQRDEDFIRRSLEHAKGREERIRALAQEAEELRKANQEAAELRRAAAARPPPAAPPEAAAPPAPQRPSPSPSPRATPAGAPSPAGPSRSGSKRRRRSRSAGGREAEVAVLRGVLEHFRNTQAGSGQCDVEAVSQRGPAPPAAQPPASQPHGDSAPAAPPSGEAAAALSAPLRAVLGVFRGAAGGGGGGCPREAAAQALREQAGVTPLQWLALAAATAAPQLRQQQQGGVPGEVTWPQLAALAQELLLSPPPSPPTPRHDGCETRREPRDAQGDCSELSPEPRQPQWRSDIAGRRGRAGRRAQRGGSRGRGGGSAQRSASAPPPRMQPRPAGQPPRSRTPRQRAPRAGSRGAGRRARTAEPAPGRRQRADPSLPGSASPQQLQQPQQCGRAASAAARPPVAPSAAQRAQQLQREREEQRQQLRRQAERLAARRIAQLQGPQGERPRRADDSLPSITELPLAP